MGKSNVNTKDSIEILLAFFSSHDDKHFLRGQNVHRIIDKYFYNRFMLVKETEAMKWFFCRINQTKTIAN